MAKLHFPTMFPTGSIALSPPNSSLRYLAVGSFLNSSANVIGLLSETVQHDSYGFTSVKSFYHPYAPTAMKWAPMRGMAARPDLLATANTSIYLWQLTETLEHRTPSRHRALTSRSAITSFDWKETKLVSGDLDRKITHWDMSILKGTHEWLAHDEPVMSVDINPHHHSLVLSCGLDGMLKVTDMRMDTQKTVTVKAHTRLCTSETDSAHLIKCAWNPVLENIVTVLPATSATMPILDIRSPNRPLTDIIMPDLGQINIFGWSPDTGTRLCTGTEQGKLDIWELTQGMQRLLQSHMQYDVGDRINHLEWIDSNKMVVASNQAINVIEC